MDDVPVPAGPGPGEVRIAIEAAGICGSDLHNFRTGQWIGRAPSTAGHELAGRILAVADDVTGLSVGERVVADSRVWCGACPDCRAGRPQFCATLGFVGEVCDGGFAGEIVLPRRLVHSADPALDPAVAAMAEPLAVALHTVARLAPAPGEPVLVAGCGTIGGLAALLLSRRHDGPLLVSDRNKQRAALVGDVTGAKVVTLDASAIADALDGGPLLHAIEATGQVPVLETLLDRVSGGGRIALVGIFHERLDLDPNRLVERGIALLGCHVFASELPEAIGLLPSLSPALRRFIGEEIAIEDVPAAYERLLRGDAAGLKTIVRPALGETCR